MLCVPSGSIVLSIRLTRYKFATPELADTLARDSGVIGPRASAAARIRSTVIEESFFPQFRLPIASRRSDE